VGVAVIVSGIRESQEADKSRNGQHFQIVHST
jgi:hypothetical protein